jgi:DNA replication protein DnaC
VRAADAPGTLEGFDFSAEGLDVAPVSQLARCEWVETAGNVILAGPIGTGKTHLAIALGIEAAKQRFHVAFQRAADLVRALREARDQRELSRLHRRPRRWRAALQAIASRHERKSVVVTTNLAFSEWPKVFADDEKLTTARPPSRRRGRASGCAGGRTKPVNLPTQGGRLRSLRSLRRATTARKKPAAPSRRTAKKR